MPLVWLHKQANGCETGIWELTESEAWLREQVDLSASEQEQLAAIKGQKRSEWLAVRLLVHKMSGRMERGALLKDEFGKPFLENSAYHISMSHTRRFAAAIAAPFSVGIDIQHQVSKIERIAHKFVGTDEATQLEGHPDQLGVLHLIWGAKEALYKAYGRRQLDFKTHLFLEDIPQNSVQGNFKGFIQKDDYTAHFDCHCRQWENCILVSARQIQVNK